VNPVQHKIKVLVYPRFFYILYIIKLNSDWSRVRLSNEDVETILKIAAKLP
jgi:hypothetical protein